MVQSGVDFEPRSGTIDVTAESSVATADDELSELMASYQAGEFQAFTELYRRLAPKVRAYLSSLTWSREQAEDLLQETFLQVHRSRHTYLPDRPLRPWVFAIARHCYLMECRAFARKRKQEVYPEEDLDVPIPPDVEGLADRLALRRALGEISEDRREALLLHHVWGFSFPEIAGMLGIGVSAAKVRAHRGVQDLRARLDKLDGEGDTDG